MDNTLPLQKLFQERIFEVPDYQRGYAWEEQQVKEFLDDLELLTSSRRHYTGTIVLHKQRNAEGSDRESADNEGTHYVETHIVDGQQRLTTIVVLLHEVSRALSTYANSSSLAQGIRKNYIEATRRDGQPLHKLSLNRDTDAFFKSSVLTEKSGVAGPPITSAQRLLSAKKLMADYLSKGREDQTDPEQWLRDLHDKVTRQLHFSLYEVDSEAEVGVIFEVMNDRGKPLTNFEKVKNYLLYATTKLEDESVGTTSRTELARSVNDAWADMLTRLMAAGLQEDEDQLLRTHWLMQYDPRSRYWDGSKSIKGKFDLRKSQGQHIQLLDGLHEYVDGLREACVCFCNALKPSRTGAFSAVDSSIRRDITIWNPKLVNMRITATFLPLLMAAQLRWLSEPEQYLEIVKLCEKFAFRTYRASLSPFRPNYSQAALFYIAYDVAHGEEFDSVVERIKQLLHPISYAFDDFMEDKRYPLYRWSGLKYFLYEYERHLASARKASPKVDWEGIETGDTIEHVLPQSIENRPYWQDRFDETGHQEYMHDIGNLALTKGNPELSNKPFPDKKGTLDFDGYCYARSPLFQEQELAKRDDWTAEAIDSRRATLLAWAKERWHIDFTGIHPAEPDDEADDDEIADEEGEE